jgi:hypothetical protein
MYSNHAALLSPRYDERDRITHQTRTKQRENEEQCIMGKWTWEEVLDGAGPWSQPGELEAAKAERRYYEEKCKRLEEQQ